jgi:tRNA threonylcarbamoyladenosine biosynthesis protein TsaE
VCLVGEMGTGKTLLTRGIAEGVGVPGGRGVRSPTFTLVHEYRGRYPIFHFDLYRLRGEEELEEIGWDEYLDRGAGVVVIEGAEKVRRVLPSERLDVRVSREGPRRRRLSFVAGGRRFESLIDALARRR